MADTGTLTETCARKSFSPTAFNPYEPSSTQYFMSIKPCRLAKKSPFSPHKSKLTSSLDDGHAICELWCDSATVEVVQRSHSSQQNESAVYYFNPIERLSSPSYLPADQDTLRRPANMAGIAEATFKVGQLTYKQVDISCQRSERGKWIHCFENHLGVPYDLLSPILEPPNFKETATIATRRLLPRLTGRSQLRFVSLNQSATSEQMYAHYTYTTNMKHI